MSTSTLTSASTGTTDRAIRSAAIITVAGSPATALEGMLGHLVDRLGADQVHHLLIGGADGGVPDGVGATVHLLPGPTPGERAGNLLTRVATGRLSLQEALTRSGTVQRALTDLLAELDVDLEVYDGVRVGQYAPSEGPARRVCFLDELASERYAAVLTAMRDQPDVEFHPLRRYTEQVPGPLRRIVDLPVARRALLAFEQRTVRRSEISAARRFDRCLVPDARAARLLAVRALVDPAAVVAVEQDTTASAAYDEACGIATTASRGSRPGCGGRLGGRVTERRRGSGAGSGRGIPGPAPLPACCGCTASGWWGRAVSARPRSPSWSRTTGGCWPRSATASRGCACPAGLEADLLRHGIAEAAAVALAVRQNANVLRPLQPGGAVAATLLSRLPSADGRTARVRQRLAAELPPVNVTVLGTPPDLPHPALRWTMSGHTGWVEALAAAPDGSWLASAADDRTVRVWDTATGALQHALLGHTDWVCAVVVAPDGSWLGSASRDGRVWIWDPATGALLRRLDGHVGWVGTLVASPAGSWLASAGDATVRV